jgi:DNA replication protein DnaD
MPKNSRGKMPKNSKGRNNASDLDLELSDFEVAPMSEHEEISQRSDSDSDQEEEIIQKSLKAANRKGKKSGGFQSMGMLNLE